MKLNEFAARQLLEERNYTELVRVICAHFSVPIPNFCIRDESLPGRPARAVLVIIAAKTTIGFAISGRDSIYEDSSFICWNWEHSYLDDENYLLVTK